MQRTSLPLIIFTALLIVSCRDDVSNVRPSESAGNKISHQEISIEIPPPLEERIKTTSSELLNPGKNNRLEANVTLQNISAENLSLVARGTWLDSSGNRYGGTTQQIDLTAGEELTLFAASRSRNASFFRLILEQSESTNEELALEPLTDPSIRIAEGYGMTFSKTAEDEVIPNLPIRGVANGQTFKAETVFFAQGLENRWRIEISDRSYDVKQGVAMARIDYPDVQTVYINFDKEPQPGDTLVQKMSYGGGYFQIKPSAEANNSTSWNTSLAYAIYIDSWEKMPSGQQPCGQPALGSASGKLYISFMGSGMGPSNSWVSGQFVDVPIVYCP